MSDNDTVQFAPSEPTKVRQESKKKNYDKIALILAAISNLLFFFQTIAIQFSYMFYISLFFTAAGLLLAVFSFIWSIILTIKMKSVVAAIAIFLSFIPIGFMILAIILMAIFVNFLVDFAQAFA